MRYLTKSKFKLAMECPTKLYYTDKDEYANQKLQDSFLEALAQGGFQVGELAKCYFRDLNPVDLKDLSVEAALARTRELMRQDNVVIFEAAVLSGYLLVRIDILIKRDKSLKLIEVKSSSVDAHEKPIFFTKTKRAGIKSDWKPYILDAAFQKLVLLQAFPDYNISANLMLLDKSAECPTDGLNQKFRITTSDSGKKFVIVSDALSSDDLSERILIEINIDHEIAHVYEHDTYINGLKFKEYVAYLADQFVKDKKILPVPGKICAKCEFNADETEKTLKSGRKECWSEVCGFKPQDFTRPSILDFWQFNKKDQFIHQGIYYLNQLRRDNVNPQPDHKSGWSRSQRQWLQVEKAAANDLSAVMDIEGLKAEIAQWRYPLHFIDFETATPAIPMNKGEHPYQGIAFQFSHHVLHEDGTVEHKDQFINDEIGINPNLKFIRALMHSLSGDEGTVFRYHLHENTYLNIIYQQLFHSAESITDKKELLRFIESIAIPGENSLLKWQRSERAMVDLCRLVERYTFDPLTKGATSIKKVFPAILQRSDFLKNKYSMPVYGAENGLRSLNFINMQWVQIEQGVVLDPYQLLPPIFTDIDMKDVELLFADDEIKAGGPATIAYMRMQFSEMSSQERKAIRQSLLRYCELDTLAMVMIVEAWLYDLSL